MNKDVNDRGSASERLSGLALLTACSAVLLLTGCGSDNREVMKGDAITALFSENTVEGQHDKHGYAFISYYESDGEFRSYQGGSKEGKPGTWKVRGDLICVQWKEKPSELCRNMVTDGKGGYWKVLFKNGKRIPIVTFKRFTAGNAQKL